MPGKQQRGQGWIRFSGIGVEFAGAVAGFALIGYWIDGHYGTSPKAMLIGSVLGIVGGGYNLIRASLSATREAKQEESKPDHDDSANR